MNPLQEEDQTPESSGSKLRFAIKASLGRPCVTYEVPTDDQLRKAILDRAAARLREKHFARIATAPRPSMVAALDPNANAVDVVADLEARYGAKIRGQDGFQSAQDRFLLEYRRLEKSLQNTSGAPLPADVRYENARQYRAVLVRQFVAGRDGQQISRSEVSERFAVDRSHVGSVLTRAGVASTHVRIERELPAQEAAQVVAKPEYDRTAKGKPISVTVNNMRIDLHAPGGRERAVIAVHEAAGRSERVTVEYQQANKLQIAGAMPEAHKRAAPQPKQPEQPGIESEAPAPRQKPIPPFMGKGYDPAWVEWQIALLLALGTTWRRQGDQLIDQETGEIVTYTHKNALAVLLDRATADKPDAHEQVTVPAGANVEDYLLSRIERCAAWEHVA